MNDLELLNSLNVRIKAAQHIEPILRVVLLKSIHHTVTKYIDGIRSEGRTANIEFRSIKQSLDKTIYAECAELGIAVDSTDYGDCERCGSKMNSFGCKYACECCGVCS